MEDETVFCRDSIVTRRLLLRLRQEELIELLESSSWAASSSEFPLFTSSTPKKQLVDIAFNNFFKKGLTLQQFADLDLSYYRANANGKKWTALHLVYKQASNESGFVFEPIKMQKEFQKALKPFFKHHAYFSRKADYMWIRLAIFDGIPVGQIPPPSNYVYLVSFPGTPYLLTSGMKFEYKDYVYQALLHAFHCQELQEWNLSGFHIESLADLLLFKDAQGGYSRYRLDQADLHPLNSTDVSSDAIKLKKQTVHRVRHPMEDDKRVVNEETALFKERDQQIRQQFSWNALPSMHRADFKFVTAFQGGEAYPYRGMFDMRVRLEGGHLSEGLRKLVQLGIAEAPLPDHLTDLHLNQCTPTSTVTL